MVLGKNLKYSSCLYNSPHEHLNKAETNMLCKWLVAYLPAFLGLLARDT